MTKVDTGSFNAFASPNLAPLAIAEVDITSKPAVSMGLSLFFRCPEEVFSVLNLFSPSFSLVNWDTVWRANTTAKFQVSTELNRNVGLLRLFPGITAATVRCSAPETDQRCFFCLCHSHLMSRGCPLSFIDVTHYRIINRHD